MLIKLVIIAEKTVFTASYYTMILSEMLKISLRINLFLYYHQFLQIYKTGGAGYNESMTGSDEARTSGSSSRPKRQSGVGCHKRAKTKKVVKEAEIMTYEEFLEKFQYNETVQGTLFQKDEMIYPEMVCNIKIVVKNKDQEDNPDKGINFQNYVLYGEDFQLQLSEALYSVANPNMKEGQMSFRLQPETEKEFYLPFFIFLHQEKRNRFK